MALNSVSAFNRRRHRELLDRVLAVIALATIVAAYFWGLSQAEEDVMPELQELLPDALRFEAISENVFAGYRGTHIIGYITTGDAFGYGGTIEVAVAVDPQGRVIDFVTIEERETPEYFLRVERGGFFDSLKGKSCQDSFRVGVDVDVISGATYTSEAIAKAVGKGCRQIASSELGLNISENSATVKFGAPEMALILLYAAGYIGHRRNFKYTRQLRWITMIAGLIILGFWFNRPLTIGNINQLLLGFWPDWQSNLYWYLLIGGILLIFTANNKNPYCEWFCPFGAAQECLGALGRAKARSAGKFKDFLKWLQRGLAWLAIVLALIFRNPGISSYEVFSAFFDQIGSTVQFALLGIVLMASLFIRRPWCNYLCPLRPVTEFIQMARRWVLSVWKKIVHEMG